MFQYIYEVIGNVANHAMYYTTEQLVEKYIRNSISCTTEVGNNSEVLTSNKDSESTLKMCIQPFETSYLRSTRPVTVNQVELQFASFIDNSVDEKTALLALLKKIYFVPVCIEASKTELKIITPVPEIIDTQLLLCTSTDYPSETARENVVQLITQTPSRPASTEDRKKKDNAEVREYFKPTVQVNAIQSVDVLTLKSHPRPPCAARGHYWGPMIFSTQPPPPPPNVIVAARFSYPPPPVPVHYVGAALFNVSGPPPPACCVAASGFKFPPPPPPPQNQSAGDLMSPVNVVKQNDYSLEKLLKWLPSAPDGHYWGPTVLCTQLPSLPPNVIVAARFNYPPPPVPAYYIGAALFYVNGPPPLPCCVAASGFVFPPPPQRPQSRVHRAPSIRFGSSVPPADRRNRRV